MPGDGPEISLDELARRRGRYPLEAYQFVCEGLRYTLEKYCGNCEAREHVTGQTLCWGLRDYALDRWGLFARDVLRRWRISATRDFGEIVYDMVNSGLMSKTETDRIEDFNGVYDFKSAFDVHLRIG